MLALTVYIMGVIGFMYPFLLMTDKGRKIWAIGAAIVWPLFVLFVVGWLVYKGIVDRRV
jgi:VIT1/CCC1 family predicted Fe2+/Mn2+ transporter